MGPIDPSEQATAGHPHDRRAEGSAALVLGQLTGDQGPAPGVAADRRVRSDRRRQKSLFAFLYGNFRPRRRASRRAAENDRFIFDWHEPQLMYVALAIVLLSCTDALFTLNLLTIGAVEANAIMDNLIQSGVESFLWIKIGTTIVSVLVLVFAAQRRIMGGFRVLQVLHVICFGYIGLILYEIYLFCLILGMDPFTLGSSILFF